MPRTLKVRGMFCFKIVRKMMERIKAEQSIELQTAQNMTERIVSLKSLICKKRPE
jgi:hypothetical protein